MREKLAVIAISTVIAFVGGYVVGGISVSRHYERTYDLSFKE